ncbi:HD domain-containing phosphohydrolase [Denitrobaculum tricleocarpae]|uniref:Response regulator n=1 Tax=Denitrobaculum tricleocarpae TaxID=2591009 RepID=A0A545TMM7_9PROT|nr:HD domain-containing phosphohydrolase [Denitrobaculum tricleocarpae]TQV78479.1 response regulator [Denitrobaculum tricleocarpae]
MNARVLFVDDDPQILSAFKRNLRKRFDLQTAEGPAAGLKAIEEDGEFAVVVSDQQMPEMDGITFLRQVKGKNPLTVRMMLTGNADQQTAMEAVNEGHIFRFMTKPCAPDDLAKAVEAAQEQYRLVTAERDLLEQTLAGSVKVLVDVLSLHNPEAFKQTARIRSWARAIAKPLKLTDPWTLNMSIMLSSIGEITLPAELAGKRRKGEALTEVEKGLVSRSPEVARDLITNIPRLGPVATAVYYQAAGFDGSGFPGDGVSGEDLPKEARVLRVLIDLAAASNADLPPASVFDAMAKNSAQYDPEILALARARLTPPDETPETEDAPEVHEVPVRLLRDVHKLHEDVVTESETVLIAAGHRLTRAMIKKIQNYHQVHKIKEPLMVIEVHDDEDALIDA